MATKNIPLLWVNKDISSKSLSNNEDDAPLRKLVSLHINSLQKGKHKTSKLSRLSFPPKTFGWRFRETCRDIWPSCRLEAGPALERFVHVPHSAWKGQACGSRGHEGGMRLQSQPRGSHWDPFSRSSVKFTSEISRVMQYFEAVCSSTALVGPKHHRDRLPNGSIGDLFQQCLSDELHMFALLATTIGHMKYLTASTMKCSDRPEYFQGKALHLLRQRLQEDALVTQQTITDIIFLASVEIYNRNFQGARVLLSLSNTLAFSLGLHQIEPYIGKMCWGSDMFLISRTIPLPYLDFSYDVGPLGLGQIVSVRNHFFAEIAPAMGSAFLEQPHIFTTNLLPDIRDVVNLAHVVQYLWTSSEAQHSIRSWIVAQSGALLHRLMAVDGLSLYGSKQGCIRVALIVWLSYIPVSAAGIAWPTSSGIRKNSALFAAADIRWQIERADMTLPHGWIQHETVLLWMVALGFLSACNQADLQWFKVKFLTQCRSLDVETYDQLSVLLARYMWIDHCEETSGHKLRQLLESPAQELDLAREPGPFQTPEACSGPPE
jgi:hypothetical protein